MKEYAATVQWNKKCVCKPPYLQSTVCLLLHKNLRSVGKNILCSFFFFLVYFRATLEAVEVLRLFAFSRAAPAAYGGSQDRGRIRAAAADLRHSHSNSGPEPCLRPTPQLTAMPDPQPTERGQGC